MNEVLKIEPEPSDASEFRAYLAREFGITDLSTQDKAMAIFRFSVLKIAQEHGLIPRWDPIELARQELIAGGITDPEIQRALLQGLYVESED